MATPLPPYIAEHRYVRNSNIQLRNVEPSSVREDLEALGNGRLERDSSLAHTDYTSFGK